MQVSQYTASLLAERSDGAAIATVPIGECVNTFIALLSPNMLQRKDLFSLTSTIIMLGTEAKNNAGAFLPWVEKYRPMEMQDIISHREIMKSIQKLLRSNQLPHILFYGPPGTGKTTMILSCARLIYGQHGMKNNTLELNASDERGIDVVRNQIKDFASTSIVFSSVPYKLIILDEADQMTHDAQAALRRIIEKYTTNVRFCIICNNVNKLIPALQSRCTKYRFAPLEQSDMVDRIMSILQSEKIAHTKEGVEAAVRISGGDMRRCINIVQGATMSFDEITEDVVHKCTGAPSPALIEQIFEALVESSFTKSYALLGRILKESNIALADFLGQLYPRALELNWKESAKAFVIDELSTLEHMIAQGVAESTGVHCLVSIFQLAKEASIRDSSAFCILKT